MPVFFDGELKICVKKSFENNEGETIEYYELYFVSNDGDNVLKINSKQDLSNLVDKSGVAELEMQEGRKPRLISFKVR